MIAYKGHGRAEGAVREQEDGRGYAAAFEGLVGFINGLLPSNEVMGQALRKSVPMYPELAIRELVANALIHQDFSVTGSGPMVELFADRLEITNPGTPLVDRRSTIFGEMLDTLSKRFISQDSMPSESLRRRPPLDAMPMACMASISKSWTCSQMGMRSSLPTRMAAGAQTSVGTTNMITAGLCRMAIHISAGPLDKAKLIR